MSKEENPLVQRLEEIRQEKAALKEEEQSIYKQSLEAPEEDKVCEDFTAKLLAEPHPFRSIKYPITINSISFGDRETLQPKKDIKWVSVRPCGEEYKGKTYLGIMLGDLALGIYVSLNIETDILNIEQSHHNPAIYVPDLNEVIYGCGSWWGEINSPEDLKQITDQTIENIWYVRALKDLDE